MRPIMNIQLEPVCYDIDVANVSIVCAEIKKVFSALYPNHSLLPIERCFDDVEALYAGERHGYHSCDMHYHDLEHVLGVTLAMVRLIDGYERKQGPKSQLGYSLALVGLVTALFHDSGYIRREAEKSYQNGAQYTKNHVSRSAEFLAEYLPEVGLGEWVWLSRKVVQFTGYEVSPKDILMENPKHRMLGKLLGTADMLAQMADPLYLEKCRDKLYQEFVLGGVAEYLDEDGQRQVVYESGEDLLRQTPKFVRNVLANRLGVLFGHAYRYMEPHFGGSNPYMASIMRNCEYLESVIARSGEPGLAGTLRVVQ